MKFFEGKIFKVDKNHKKVEKPSVLEVENITEKRYKEQLEPILEVLKPENESFEEYKNRTINDLEESAKKIQLAQGKNIEYDEEKNFADIKNLLLSRIRSVLEDERKYRYTDKKRAPDENLVLKSKLALLLSGDTSDLQQHKHYIENLTFQDIQFYLGIYHDSNKKYLTEEELDILVKAGFGKQLATIPDHQFDNLKNVPESLLLELIKVNDSFWVNNLIEKHSSKEKYSRAVFEALALKGPSTTPLKNIEKFKDVSFEDCVDIESPTYPYHVREMIEKLRTLNLPDKDFKENLDYIVKHQKVGRDEMKIPEIQENYKDTISKLQFFNDTYDRNQNKWVKPDKESGLRVAKELIEDGKVSFLYENWGYVKELAESEYDWLINNVGKYDQEHLLMDNHNLLKPKDQLNYAKKLISQKKEHLIIADSVDTRNGALFAENTLDQYIFDKISEKNAQSAKDMLDRFYGLNQEIFVSLFKSGYFEEKGFGDNLKSFNFPEGTHYSTLLKETEPFNGHLKIYYFSKFIDNTNTDERKKFIIEYKKQVSQMSENKGVDIQDKKLYELVCREIYPKRNYDTYKNIDKYEDRAKDLDKYKFNRDGYEIKVDGVLGYKIKEGAIAEEKIINDFSTRIENIKEISNTEQLNAFLDKEISESKAETLEGKILEYFNQKGYTLDTMNVLLAYQLQGQYDEFVAGSVDRVAGAEDQTSKNYILLDELANKYGDSMKETIKAVQEAVANSADQKLFAANILEENGETYAGLGQSIVDDLGKIPKDKITDETIQRKIVKTIKNTFQGMKDLQERAKYFSELFSRNDLDNFSEVWKKHTDQLFVVSDAYSIDMKKIQALQSITYQLIQNEISKYEEIREVDEREIDKKLTVETKGSKERKIKGYFSKNKENAHARMVGDVCLAQDPNMLKNENYFEFVMFDPERQKCVGTTMLLEMPEPDGKKYLLYCPNPSVGLVSEVSAKKLYQAITDQIKKFATENKFDGVLVDKTHGRSTNRAGLFQNSLDQSCLKDKKGSDVIMNLENSHLLGGGYTYQKNLQIIWQKQNA